MAVCLIWLIWPTVALRIEMRRPDHALRLLAFHVGDGTCTVVRLHDGRESHTLMFDCGSQQYLDIGQKSIAPSLKRLGIERIDTLLISHADLDHIAGVLDVARVVPIGRVLATPQMLAYAAHFREGPIGHVVRELSAMGLEPQTATRGWRERVAGAELELLWPPEGFSAPRQNDVSLVLSIRAGGRRVLLNGDIQQMATVLLLAGDDLRADVTDLPHHGAFVEASPRWLHAVEPSVVIQSAGHARLHRDPWASVFATYDAPRLITAQSGMIDLKIGSDGAIRWQTFKPAPAHGR